MDFWVQRDGALQRCHDLRAVGYVDHWVYLLLILRVSGYLTASAKVRTRRETSRTRELNAHSDTRRPRRALNKTGTRLRVPPLPRTT